MRVGGSTEIPIDCRIISATNRSATEIAEKNCLREDIYFRLAVFPIQVPPLRERVEDIAPLVDYFLTELNRENGTSFSIRPQDLARIQQYAWPGNVRELRHAVHRAFILTPEDQSTLNWPDDYGSPFAVLKKTTPAGLKVGKTISEIERELIEITLNHLHGDKRHAAEILGISLKTLYNRLNEYEDFTSHEKG
jgi:two-component system response regulator HydG